jgi:hypothetical protein
MREKTRQQGAGCMRKERGRRAEPEPRFPFPITPRRAPARVARRLPRPPPRLSSLFITRYGPY